MIDKKYKLTFRIVIRTLTESHLIVHVAMFKGAHDKIMEMDHVSVSVAGQCFSGI